MKSFILFLSMICVTVCSAQVTPIGAKLSTADQAGLLYASNFGQWQVPAGNLGQYSWDNGSYCLPTVGSVYPGITINAFTVGTPVKIVDTDTPSHDEIVIPTAVTIVWAGTDPVSCSISITPVYGHNHFYFTSATGGLQEAINWAGTTPYQVIVTPDWSLLGGITSTITSSTGNASVSILDDRTACSVAYLWSGAYVAQSSSCAGLSGSGTLGYIPVFTGTNSIGNSAIYQRANGGGFDESFYLNGGNLSFYNYGSVGFDALSASSIYGIYGGIVRIYPAGEFAVQTRGGMELVSQSNSDPSYFETNYGEIYMSPSGFILKGSVAVSAGSACNNTNAFLIGLTGNFLVCNSSGVWQDYSTFSGINPMSTLGDTMYGGASGAATRLAGNTTTTPMVLAETGDGTNAAAPVWNPFIDPSRTDTQTMEGGLNVPLLNQVAYTSAYTSLAAAISALPSGGHLIVNSLVSVPSTTVLPENINTSVVSGGFTISSGAYLQFQGGFDAGLFQVFFGDGPAFFYGGSGSTPRIYPQWFGAMGNAKAGGFTCTSGSNVITPVGHLPWNIGESITLVGAGAAGSNLVTSVETISSGYPATSFTTLDNCATTVSATGMAYNVDDSVALAKWTRSASGGAPNDKKHAYTYGSQYGPSRLYLPKGAYNACSASVPFYGATSFEGESSVVTGASYIIQCNPKIPAATLSADNFAPDVNVIPTASTPSNDIGNGTSYFTGLGFYGSWADNTPDVGALQLLNGSNVNGDNKIYNMICENISGTCIMLGFVTTTVGSVASGSTSMTVANGVSLLNGMEINIVGAGVSGGIYKGTITSAGRSNSITFTPATSTTVTDANVMPVRDVSSVDVFNSEIDVATYYFIEGQGNAQGGANVYNSEIFGVYKGAINFHSNGPMSLGWYNTSCAGCGNLSSGSSLLGWAIIVNDGSASNSATVKVDGSTFTPLSVPPGAVGTYDITGGISASNLYSFVVHNDHFYGIDASVYSGSVGIQSTENTFVDVKDNTFSTGGLFEPTANYRVMIDICCNSATMLHGSVTGNTIIDTKTGAADLAAGIKLDFSPNNGTFGPNMIVGSFNAPMIGSYFYGSDLNPVYASTVNASSGVTSPSYTGDATAFSCTVNTTLLPTASCSCATNHRCDSEHGWLTIPIGATVNTGTANEVIFTVTLYGSAQTNYPNRNVLAWNENAQSTVAYTVPTSTGFTRNMFTTAVPAVNTTYTVSY